MLVYADICPLDDEVVDAQRTCRRGSETEITQVMSPWGQCSNPCGEGRKTRNVKGIVCLSFLKGFWKGKNGLLLKC